MKLLGNMSYIVQIIPIYFACILQSLQFGLFLDISYLKVKLKLSLCLTNYALCHEGVGRVDA
jgi:hypothetical protein